MNTLKIKPATVECFLARLFGSLAAGVLVGFAAAWVATHFQLPFDYKLQFAIGAVAAGLCWPLSRRAFEFTADCMQVPTVGPAFQKSPSPPLKAAERAPAPARVAAGDPSQFETVPLEDGSLKVVITVKGLTKREFNTLRGRLERVPGVTWSHPVNLHDGRRRMEGVMPPGPSRPETLKRLEEISGHRV